MNHIHYEVWFDSDGDEVVDVMTYEDNFPGDHVELTFAGTGVPLGLAELRWYAVDNADNVEVMHYQEHLVVDYY